MSFFSRLAVVHIFSPPIHPCDDKWWFCLFRSNSQQSSCKFTFNAHKKNDGYKIKNNGKLYASCILTLQCIETSWATTKKKENFQQTTFDFEKKKNTEVVRQNRNKLWGLINVWLVDFCICGHYDNKTKLFISLILFSETSWKSALGPSYAEHFVQLLDLSRQATGNKLR